MISFVAYFSTAEEAEGFVVMNGHGSAPAEFTGGPEIESGTYRIEGDELVRVESDSNAVHHGVNSSKLES
ncbi:MAG: hypothetical protein KJZ80_20640 [Hyphomicrobiaceae bacterium]|nr:hypothetical protein [Hyphomicrobiaceae bacterium]